MRTAWIVVVTVLTVVATGSVHAAGPESIRRGWDSWRGRPYNGCSWLVVTGPAAAAANLVEDATRAYRAPDPEQLASFDGRVFIEIRTITERTPGCSNRIMEEVIFIDKDSDLPSFRLQLESIETALSNGFGASWESNDAIAVGDLAAFTSALQDKYHVMVVYEDGATDRIGQGARGTVWSGDETRKIQ